MILLNKLTVVKSTLYTHNLTKKNYISTPILQINRSINYVFTINYVSHNNIIIIHLLLCILKCDNINNKIRTNTHVSFNYVVYRSSEFEINCIYQYIILIVTVLLEKGCIIV